MTDGYCIHGHDLSAVGVYVCPTGYRECRACRRIANARYAVGNPEKKREQRRLSAARRYAEDPAKIKENIKKWRDANPESYRVIKRNKKARRNSAEGHHTAAEILFLANKQKYRCANPVCFTSIKKKYHADHVMPLARGGSNWITNIQLLCPDCNQKKHTKDPFVWALRNGVLL